MDKGSIALTLFGTLMVILIIWGDYKDDQADKLRHKIAQRIQEVDRDYIYDPNFNKDSLLYYNNLARQILEKTSKENVNILKPVTIESWLNPEEVNYLQKYRKFN